MRGTVDRQSGSGPHRIRNGGGIGLASALLALWFLTSVLVHSLPHEASDRASAPILSGAEIAPPVSDVFNHACIDCHSEKTRWPWYSNVAPASWFIESDVKRARSRLNLSRWDSLDTAEQRQLLTAIATVMENREMPPQWYVMLQAQ